MHFSLEVLRQLAQEKSAKVPDRVFMSGLVEPLLRRAMKKRIRWETLKEIIDLTVSYLKKNPKAASNISFRSGSFLLRIIRLWSNRPSAMEKGFIAVLRMLQPDNDRRLFDCAEALRIVNPSLRYRYLQLCFLWSRGEPVDIDDDDDLESLRMSQCPCHIFVQLERNQALNFFRRLRRINPDFHFASPFSSDGSRTILQLPAAPDSSFADPALLKTLLERGESLALEEGRKAVDGQKQRASTSREQADRALFAKSAIFFAIASGSIELYGETLVWARRFNRDPLTVKTLYGSDATHTSEGIALLSGIPTDLSPTWTVTDLHSGIVKGNNVLLAFLETACSALREPSFYAPDWTAVLSLFRLVVEARFRRSGAAQRFLELSQEEMSEIIWKETLKLLIEVENIALKPGHEDLAFNSAYGPLDYGGHNPYLPRDALPAALRFLDNLAKARDQLWRKFRPTIFPAAASLPQPWPRGLPIQCLIRRFECPAHWMGNHTPYISSRAANVVFCPPEIGLSSVPDDKETRDAIGSFVDSFSRALCIYVLQRPSPQEREECRDLAWSHTLNVFSTRGIDSHEAYRTLKVYFEQALPGFWKPIPAMERLPDYPVLPADAVPLEQTEWNPATNQPSPIASRDLLLTCLDCNLAISTTSDCKVTTTFHTPRPRTQPRHFPGIWSWERALWPQTIREGQVLSALLYLDSKKGGRTRLLASAFPSETDVRYPPLFLDPEFLDCRELNEFSARSMLSRHINDVPPTLLSQLTEATIEKLSPTPSNSVAPVELTKMAYGLLSLLSKSDRPHLASVLVLKTIMEQPDASSWHRRLLTITFLRRLSANQSQALFQSFTTAIQLKLKQQAEASEAKQPGGAQNSAPKTFVKVTTVKYLAQLLDGADFVPESFSVDVLCELFQKASHLDIRVATVESMLSMLGRCSDNSSKPLAKKLLQSLKTTIPIISNLNERRPLAEQDWIEAERTGLPPKVYEDGAMDAIPPIMAVLAAFPICISYPLKLRQAILTSILLPAIDESTRHTSRWIEFFLAKHQSILDSSDLPPVPFRPAILGFLLRCCCANLLPASILEMYHQYVLANIRPSADLASFNKMITGSPLRIRDSNDSRYWLSLFNRGLDSYDFGGFNVVSILGVKWRPSEVPEGIEIEQVQRIAFEQAEALLLGSDFSFSAWNRFIRQFEPSYSVSDWNIPNQEAWIANSKPVLQRIIQHIDKLRRREWQRNPERQPAVLPPTFGLRLWLVRYPSQPSSASASEKCKDFAEQMSALVDEICRGGKPYHEEFLLLKTAASKCPSEDSALVGCHLGNIGKTFLSWLTTEDLLRVELAEALFRAAGKPREKETTRLSRETLESWKANENETVRMRGIQLLAADLKLFKQDP